MTRKSVYMLALALFGLAALPELALASGGIGEFSAPLEKVMNTITGPAGKTISIVAMALCGLVFIMNKDDLSGGFKLLLGVVFGISFIAFASSIVNSVFSFSGAVVWNLLPGQDVSLITAATSAYSPFWGSGAVV